MSTEKEAKPAPEIIIPYETLRPCRSRVIAGGVMTLIAFALILVMSG